MSNLKKRLLIIIIFLVTVMSIISVSDVMKFNFSVADIFAMLFGLAYIADFKAIKAKEEWWINIYFLVFILSIILSNLLNHVEISTTISELIKVVILAVYLFIGYLIPRYGFKLKDILKVWLIGTWANIIIGLIIQFSAFLGKQININTVLSPRTRFMGLLTDANLAATYLTVSLFLALIYRQLNEDRKSRIFSSFTAIMCGVCILLTQSRGGLVGLSVGLLLYIIVNYRKIDVKVLYVIPILIIIYLGILDIDHMFFNNALTSNIANRIESAAQGQEQFIIRKNLSLASIQMGLDHPVIGVGRGNFVNNSRLYIDKLYSIRDDVIYRESIRHIPHNMFAGIFAELGIIGLLSFASIFFVLLRRWIRSSNPVKSAVIIMYIAFFVQSLVLSLENFRGLWLLTGMLLTYASVDMPVYEDIYKAVNRKAVMAYLIIGILIMGMLYVDLGRRVQEDVILIRKPYTVIIDSSKQETLKLRYYLEASSDRVDNISAVINIYEISDMGEKLVRTVDYWRASGLGEIRLDKDISKYKVEFIGTENPNTEAKVTDIRYENKQGSEVALNNYKYLSDNIVGFLGSKGLLGFRAPKYQYADTKKGINILLGNSIEYVGNYIEEENGAAVIRLRFKALEKIDNDYVLNIIAGNYNINNAPYYAGGYNSFTVSRVIEPKTSTWEPGNIYEVVFPFEGEDTEYDLSFYLSAKDDREITNTKIALGKVRTDGFKLAEYLNRIKDNQIVILSIKDEGSRTIDADTMNALRKLGLNKDLRGKFRYSYVAIGGRIEGLSALEDLQWEKINKVYKKGDMLGDFALPFSLELSSAGYLQGNISSIKIDGVEYSKNKRGLNIVVYDLDNNEVVDSINVDTYTSIYLPVLDD